MRFPPRFVPSPSLAHLHLLNSFVSAILQFTHLFTYAWFRFRLTLYKYTQSYVWMDMDVYCVFTNIFKWKERQSFFTATKATKKETMLKNTVFWKKVSPSMFCSYQIFSVKTVNIQNLFLFQWEWMRTIHEWKIYSYTYMFIEVA